VALASLLIAPLALGEIAAWDALDQQARTLFTQGRIADAESTMRQALQLAERRYGTQDTHVIGLVGDLALILKTQGKFVQAEALYLRAAAIVDKLPAGDALHAQSLRDLARAYVAEGKFADAESSYLQLIDWQLANSDPKRGDLANIEGELAGVYLKLGRKSDADRMMRRSFGDVGAPARADGMMPMLADVYTDDQKSAAVHIELARRRFLAIGDRCVGRAGGEMLRFFRHLTEIENLDVTLPADKVLTTIPPAQHQQLQRLLRDDVQKPAIDAAACESFAADLRQKRRDYETTEPAATKTLRAIYAGDEDMRIAKRDADLTSGCIKQAYSSGERGFDATRAWCECHTRAIKHNAGDTQIDAWLDALDTRSPPPWMAKALAEAQQCSVVGK
jgi:tetratricopeptide (TPR) repeat protein